MYYTILCTLIGVLSVADLDRVDRVSEPCQPLQIDQIIRCQSYTNKMTGFQNENDMHIEQRTCI